MEGRVSSSPCSTVVPRCAEVFIVTCFVTAFLRIEGLFSDILHLVQLKLACNSGSLCKSSVWGLIGTIATKMKCYIFEHLFCHVSRMCLQLSLILRFGVALLLLRNLQGVEDLVNNLTANTQVLSVVETG